MMLNEVPKSMPDQLASERLPIAGLSAIAESRGRNRKASEGVVEVPRRAQKAKVRGIRRYAFWLKPTAVVAIVSFVYSGIFAPLGPVMAGAAYDALVATGLDRFVGEGDLRRMRAGRTAIFGTPGNELSAQPSFREFADERQDMERYRDRADRLGDADAWTNYVELGIASEFVQWEESAYEELRDYHAEIDANEALDDDQKEFEKNLAQAQLDAAALVWQQDAEDFLFERRGEYRANLGDVESQVDQIADDVYAALLADIEANFAGQSNVDLAAWDAAFDAAIAPHSATFEAQLTSELAAVESANAGLSGAELAAFDTALDSIEAEIRQEFAFRDSFFAKRARNSYVTERRADDLSARLFAERSSADAVGDEILAATESELATVDDMLAEAVTETESALDGPGSADIIDDIAGDWQTKTEAVITAGLDRWDRAEEDLYTRRLAWLESSKQSREEGEAIWRAQHEKIKERRTAWLSEVEAQIREGREAWAEKFAEFAASRTAAEDEMTRFITEERERRAATLGQVGDMVLGGGAALAEAKDAYRYFQSLVQVNAASPYSHRNDAELLGFYQRQRDIHAAAIGSFTAMLGGVEGVLHENMQGTANYTGLLRDRRTFAGTLPADVAALGAANFQNDLVTLMNSRSEDFVLYRRDIEGLIERNTLFTERAAELDDAAVFDYSGAGTLADLLGLIDGLDIKYTSQQRELREIYFRTRTAVDDADRLAQIKTDIAAFFPGATNREARLRTQVTDYFGAGLDGYYLTENENDPYLLTDAEYEWELLRRERNYLSKRFARAEAVKRYADLANQFEAGLEMAQVTQERAEVAELRANVREMSYQLLKGDRAADADFTAFLADARARLAGREPELNSEAAILAAYDPGARPTSSAAVQVYVDAIDAHLIGYVTDADERATHRLTALREKLNNYRAELDAGASAAQLEDRWTVLAGGADAVEGEVSALLTEFDFAGLTAEIDALEAQAAEETIPELLDRVVVAKETVRVAGDTLRDAKDRLDLARAEYRQAYLDFKVLNDPNAKEIIANDLLSTTTALTNVLHHMRTIEDIPGFAGRLFDPVKQKRIEYLYGIQQRTQAQASLDYTNALSDTVLGLEESKKRLEALQTALLAESADAKLDGKSAREIADFLIGLETQITGRVSADEALRSHPAVLAAMDAVKAESTTLTGLETDLAQAIADGDPAADIAVLRARVSESEERIRARAEALIAGVRGEERARRDAALRMLDIRDGGGDPLHNLETLGDGLVSDSEQLGDDIQAMGRGAADTLETFLNANRDQDFATILEALNTTIAGLARDLQPGDGYSAVTATAQLNQYRRYEMARQWVLQNRAALDRANAAPDESDRRTTTEKWDAIIAAVDDLAEDADYLATFRAGLPNSAGDAWVTTYRSERSGLLTRVAGVLAAPDVSVAYGALSEDDRRALNSYGMDASVSGGAADLRRALELAEDGIENDLASLDENYAAIYLRERKIAIQLELGPELNLVRDYNVVAARFQADQAERNILDDDRATVEAAIVAAGGAGAAPELAARRDDIDARLAVLNARMAVDEAQVESLGDQIRVRQRELAEISEARKQIAGANQSAGSPGITNSLASLAGRHIDLARTTLELREWGLGLMRSVDRVPGGPAREDNPDASGNAPTPVETIKAAIGMYELDRSGEIVRDSSGAAIVSAEFVALGVTDPAAELGDVFNGNMRGDTLELFAERLIAWQADPARAGQVAPEVSGAIGLIESELYSLIAARRIIDQRHSTGDAIAAGADAAIETAQQIQNKLSQVAGLESAIQDALTNARSAGTDEARAVLGVLEQRQYAELLYLFDGYAIDPDTGELSADGVTHTGGSERLGDIRRLADRFRVNLEQERVAEIVSAYADAGLNFLVRLESNPASLPVEQAAFLAAYSAEIDGASVVAAVSAIADDADFRANLWSYVEGMSDRALFKSEIAAVLRTNPGNAAALKAAVLSALSALQTRIDDTLEVELGRADAIVHRDRDLDVSTSVADLIAAYATRATDAQSNLNPAIAGVSDALSVADATTAIQAAIDALGTAPGEQAAAYADIKRELGEVLSASAAGDAASLKAEAIAALGAYADPAAADTLTLEGELYLREMRAAIAISDSADTYDADDYPEELREFVLVRGYTLAEQRYADYLALKNSALAEEQEAAVLDLRGLTGDFARRILLNDFADYRSAAGNDVAGKIAAARAADEPPYTISAYLSEYLSEVGSNSSLLPRGGADLVEDLAVREYQRIAAAQTAGGGNLAALAQLDEDAYLADFRTYLLLAKVEDHFSGAGYNHATAGATEADRLVTFTAEFENFLDSAAYSIGGETVRQRLLNSAQIDGLLQVAFARLEQGADLDRYIPAALDQRRLDGTLNDPPQDPDALLPAELLAIPGYAGLDYRQLAYTADAQYGKVLAQLEAGRQLEDDTAAGRIVIEGVGLNLSDAELDNVIHRAGHSALSVADKSLVRTMLRVRATEMYTTATGGDALLILRNDRAYTSYYPDAATQRAHELFVAQNSKAIQGVNAKFFAALAEAATDDRLREAASRSESADGSRGETLRAVIERSRGASTAYYSGLSAEMQTAVDELSDRLFVSGPADQRFDAKEIAALYAHASAFETNANYTADRELISSGLFEELESRLRAAVSRSADSTLADYVSANPNTAVRAFVEQVFVDAGTQGAPTATAATVMSGHPAMAAAVASAIEGMREQTRSALLAEQGLITRFFDQFAESDQERRHIRDMLRDPSLAHPDQGLALQHSSNQTRVLAAARKQGTAEALTRSIAENRGFFSDLGLEQTREIAVSQEVKQFGSLRGNDPTYGDNRHAHYRTFAGSEREHQDEEYQNYVTGGGTDSFADWTKGRYIEVESLGITDAEALLSGDYDATLTSDRQMDLVDQRVLNGRDTATTTDDEDVDVIKVRTVGQVNAMSFATPEDELSYTYFANIANNYMEAATKLNAALNGVWQAGQFANERVAANSAITIRAELAATYDPNTTGPSAAANLQPLTDRRNDATAQLATYGDAQLGTAQNEITQTRDQFEQAAKKYAESARRKQIESAQLIQFARGTFNTALNELEGANNEFNAAEIASETARTTYDTLVSDYTNKLNQLSGKFRDWQASESERETRQAVLDFANTPYIATGDTNDADPSNVQRQYNLALAALEDAQDRLATAAFNVQTEDRIEDFAAIVAGIEAGTSYLPLNSTQRDRLAELREAKFRNSTPLTALEESELTALTHREMYERYADVIATRKDYIKHTMRMIRVEKAAAIIKQDIEEKRLLAEEKQAQFNNALNHHFGAAAPTQPGITQDRLNQARMGVYQRLVAKMETGAPLFNEFRGWYFGSSAWMPSYGGVLSSAVINGGAINPIGVATSAEIIGGAIDATAMPPADAQNFAIWQSNGGRLLEYNNFQGAYFGYLMSLMAVDAATLTLAVTTIAMSPLIPVGYTMIATGTALVAQGTALVASIVGAAVGTTMIGNGVALIAAGYSQIALATAAITSAGLAQMFAGLGSVFAGFAAASTATYGSVAEVRKKELEYQTAQAELDYLTKAPDLATVKDRLKNYGSQNEDPTDAAYNLYQLTDEDLVYLMDLVGGTPNYAGATPDTEEQSEILDVTGRRNNVQFRDSAGRRYNPHDRTTVPPGPLVNGSYAGYTRVLEQSHDRDVKSYAYYRLINETDPDQIAYDLGEVTASMLNHGNALREDRKQKYVNAGNAAGATDSTFVFRERDATYSSVFNAATDRTHGGREFAGYRTTFSDYAENQQAVFDRELNQRIQVQQKEWDLREQELNDQYADWEARMNTILTRGRAGWGTNENNFLQEMREWERQMDADKAAAEALWEERVNDHFQAKSDWESNIRSQVTAGNITEALSEAVNQMNAQIVTMNENMGTSLETADRNAVIAQAIQQIENDQPSNTEKLDLINQSIEKFNTTLSLSELTGTNLGKNLVGLNSDCREDLRKQRKNAQVYTNTKIFQQYQAMFDNLLEQIEAQNRATQTQATSDAIAAGFIQSGSQFIKAGAGAESFGVVDAVVGFDGVTAIREEQQRHGSLHGLRGTGAEPASYENRDIIRFLESADSVQVEAFFDHQKLVFGKVAESIMGAGKPEERETTLQPNEEIHGRLGVWLGRPSDQKITQGLLEAAGDSYYNDKEALQRVAQSATGYGELGAAAVRPSGIGAGFYTQLWFYNQQFEKESSSIISAPFNEGWLGTGVAKFYNNYNLFVGAANTYKTAKLNSQFYGTDQANIWRNEVAGILSPAFKGNNKTGDLEVRMSMQEWIASIPIAGGIINSGISYDANGNQRRGGWKWDPKAGGAATVSAVSSFFLGIYGTAVGEYINKQSFGDEHSNYDQYGTNTSLGSVGKAYAGLVATALGAKAAKEAGTAQRNANSKYSNSVADAARDTATTHQTADIFRGAGVAGSYYRNKLVGGLTFGSVGSDGFKGIGALAAGIANNVLGTLGGAAYSIGDAASGFSQRMINGLSGNGWRTDRDIVDEGIAAMAAPREALYAVAGVESEAQLKHKFKTELFYEQTPEETDAFLQALHDAGVNVDDLAQFTNTYRRTLAAQQRADSIASAQASQSAFEYLKQVYAGMTDGGDLHADAVGNYRDRLAQNRDIDAEIRATISRAEGKGVRRGQEKVVPSYAALLKERIPDADQRAEFYAQQSTGFQDDNAYRAGKDRYREALRVHSKTARTRLRPGVSRVGLKDAAVARMLTPEESRIFQDTVLPNYRKWVNEETAISLGRTKNLFQRQTAIQQARAGAGATAEWAIRNFNGVFGGSEAGSWSDYYNVHYSSHQKKVNEFNNSMNEVYKSLNGSNDAAISAAMEHAFEADLATGSMQVEMAIMAADLALSGPIGRAVVGARIALNATRAGFSARSAAYLGGRAAFGQGAGVSRLVQSAARSGSAVRFGANNHPVRSMFNPLCRSDACVQTNTRGALHEFGIANINEKGVIDLAYPKPWKTSKMTVVSKRRKYRLTKEQHYIVNEQPMDERDAVSLFQKNGLDVAADGRIPFGPMSHEDVLDSLIRNGQSGFLFRLSYQKDLGHMVFYNGRVGRMQDFSTANMDYMPLDDGLYSFRFYPIR